MGTVSDPKFAELRRKAEELIRHRPHAVPKIVGNMLETIHELSVHQMELQIQNEELKTAQQELSDLYRKYSDLYEFAPCGYVTLNAKGIITQANLAAAGLLGGTRNVLLRSGFGAFVAEGWRTCYHESLRRAGETGKKQSVELRLKGKSGSPVWIWADIEANRDRDNSVVQWRMTLADITEKKNYTERLEETVENRTRALRKKQEELLVKERLAVLGHFAGSVSHELRNPLAVIDSSVYFLKMKIGHSDEKISRHLEMISANVRKSTDIIQSLLHLSQMRKSETEKIGLARLVSETLRGSGIPDSVEVVLNLPGEPVFLDIEIEQMRMALKNIIKNAVQAMDEIGRLSISTRKTETGYIEIELADTGKGIAPEHIEKVFEPLFSTKTHGIGFGLSITKMIIENCGGTVWVESGWEGGAAFIVRMPFASADG